VPPLPYFDCVCGGLMHLMNILNSCSISTPMIGSHHKVKIWSPLQHSEISRAQCWRESQSHSQAWQAPYYLFIYISFSLSTSTSTSRTVWGCKIGSHFVTPSAANHNLIMHKIVCICIIDKVHACMYMHCIVLAFP
jgi:hypothetical protein